MYVFPGLQFHIISVSHESPGLRRPVLPPPPVFVLVEGLSSSSSRRPLSEDKGTGNWKTINVIHVTHGPPLLRLFFVVVFVCVCVCFGIRKPGPLGFLTQTS